ncbi:MAG TPA: OmpA family protein, partial [Methylomirabilota bacterium]|nr:OmpA family protein [Methylomirabilota bacterium]
GNAPSKTLDPKVPLSLYEARNAVQIARAVGAEKYAADSFRKAAGLLQTAETSFAHKGEKRQLEMNAREAVQTAEDARAISAKRIEEERQAQERAAAAEREARAKAQAEAAERAKLEAQLAAERAAREKAEAEAARAAALAQQQEAQRKAEEARQAAERAAREKAEADAARAAAVAQQQEAQARAEQARKAAEEAERARQKAEAEKADLRAQLLAQLNAVLQTRDTARGLIVSMSDVLFDTGSATLRSAAREKLAKISGILLAHPGLNLQVEGHTDSVGSDEFNQQLSERRADSVRDFLLQQGVLPSSVAARGFGKTQPVASNDTPEGRQRNRRVEIVVNGEAIGVVANASSPSP